MVSAVIEMPSPAGESWEPRVGAGQRVLRLWRLEPVRRERPRTGDFTNNLCVLSRGRQAPVTQLNATPFAANNFGWEGTTLWLQGPRIDVIGNHLYRAKRAVGDRLHGAADAGGQFDYPAATCVRGRKARCQAGRFGHSTGQTGSPGAVVL
jgi:hypothetical protein